MNVLIFFPHLVEDLFTQFLGLGARKQFEKINTKKKLSNVGLVLFY